MAQKLNVKMTAGDSAIKADFGAAYGKKYSGDYSVTPSEETQTLPTAGSRLSQDIVVSPIPSEYIIPSGSQTFIEDGTYDVTSLAEAVVEVGSPPLETQSRSYTPSETAQSEDITPSEGYYGLDKVSVTVDAIDSDYVGSAIDRRSSTDLTASGATVTAPAGYYAASASKSVASGTAGTPTATKGSVSNHSVSVTPSVTNTTGYITGDTKTGAAVTVSASELVSGTYTVDSSGTKDVTNYASASVPAGTAGTPSAAKGSVSNHSVSVTPSVTNTAGFISGGTLTGTAVSVSASELVSGTYNVTSSGTKDVTNYASASVPSGTEGTPTAAKGTVSNHSVSVTPSVTNVAGYISGGTKSGTAVSVSASELVSGTKSITSNGTNIDVTNYAAVDVSVSGGAPVLQTITKTYTPTTSQQTETITAGSGYDGIEEVDVTVNAISPVRTSSDLTASGATVTVPSGWYASQATKSVSSMTLPSSPSSSSSGTSKATISRSTSTRYLNIPAGYNSTEQYYTISAVADGTAGTPTATKGSVSNHSVSVTPSVTNTTGYIAGSTKTGTAVTVSASELVSGSETKTANGTYDVTNLAELVVNVSGGGTSKNVQTVQQSSTRINSTSYGKACGDITVAKAGTYDIYWSAYRTSSTGNWGTRLYINGSAASGTAGTEQTTFVNSYYQAIHLSNVSLSKNDVVSVYGKSRGTNYYLYVGQLTIIEA